MAGVILTFCKIVSLRNHPPLLTYSPERTHLPINAMRVMPAASIVTGTD